MAISVFMRYQSGRDAVTLYESVVGEMRLHGEAIREGLIYHLAAVVPHGMFIADAWETREAFNTFALAKTLPLIEKRGLVSPEVEFGEIYQTVEAANSLAHGCALVTHFDGNVDDVLRQLDEACAMAGLASAPAGLLYHWSLKRQGGICTVGHWQSREDWERFYSDAYGPAMRAAGLPEPRLEFYDIYNTIDARAVNAQPPA